MTTLIGDDPAVAQPVNRGGRAASTAFTRHSVSLFEAMRRGFAGQCPNCGEGRLFRGYIAPAAACSVCGQNLAQYRADDAPAYFTILIVGHIIVPGLLMLEMSQHPPLWVHMALWVPLTLLLTLALLPRAKGALIGLLWSHGVGE